MWCNVFSVGTIAMEGKVGLRADEKRHARRHDGQEKSTQSLGGVQMFWERGVVPKGGKGWVVGGGGE